MQTAEVVYKRRWKQVLLKTTRLFSKIFGSWTFILANEKNVWDISILTRWAVQLFLVPSYEWWQEIIAERLSIKSDNRNSLSLAFCFGIWEFVLFLLCRHFHTIEWSCLYTLARPVYFGTEATPLSSLEEEKRKMTERTLLMYMNVATALSLLNKFVNYIYIHDVLYFSCTFHTVGTAAGEQKYNSLCILSLNIINEKVRVQLAHPRIIHTKTVPE